jgi:hypothetical protein
MLSANRCVQYTRNDPLSLSPPLSLPHSQTHCFTHTLTRQIYSPHSRSSCALQLHCTSFRNSFFTFSSDPFLPLHTLFVLLSASYALVVGVLLGVDGRIDSSHHHWSAGRLDRFAPRLSVTLSYVEHAVGAVLRLRAFLPAWGCCNDTSCLWRVFFFLFFVH